MANVPVILLLLLALTGCSRTTPPPPPAHESSSEQAPNDDLQKLTDEDLDRIFRESPVDSDTDILPPADLGHGPHEYPLYPHYPFPFSGPLDPQIYDPNYPLPGKSAPLAQRPGSKAWTAHLDALNEAGLDVVIVFDSTGSMGSILLETRTRIRQLMGVLTYLVPNARVALVTYRDTKEFDPVDYEYTTKAKPFTTDVKTIEAWLRGVEALGGGDIPEAVYQGLDSAMTLKWNEKAHKVIILFGDAPPRPENDGLRKLYDLCAQWHKRTGGTISCIDTSEYYEGYKMMPEFVEIVKAGSGEAILLKTPGNLIRQLAVLTFGSQWKDQVEQTLNKITAAGPEVRIIEGD